jgi:hypothetical protein
MGEASIRKHWLVWKLALRLQVLMPTPCCLISENIEQSPGALRDESRSARRGEPHPLHGSVAPGTARRPGFARRPGPDGTGAQQFVEQAYHLADALQGDAEVGREESAVADFHEAVRQDMQQEAADELRRLQVHEAPFRRTEYRSRSRTVTKT